MAHIIDHSKYGEDSGKTEPDGTFPYIPPINLPDPDSYIVWAPEGLPGFHFPRFPLIIARTATFEEAEGIANVLMGYCDVAVWPSTLGYIHFAFQDILKKRR